MLQLILLIFFFRRWSRREEQDFYRVVSSFGVDFNRKTDSFDWGRFRLFAKLKAKTDQTLTDYFKSFYAMCKKVVGRHLTEEEEILPLIDSITEEKANRCLARIDLLSKVREEILFHSELDERLKLCQPQLDLPEWWICGKHDKDLLIGSAKYGLSRLDYNLMNDPELSFIEVVKNFEAQTFLAEEKKANEDLQNDVKVLVNFLIDKIETISKDENFKLNILSEEEIKKEVQEDSNILKTDGIKFDSNSSNGETPDEKICSDLSECKKDDVCINIKASSESLFETKDVIRPAAEIESIFNATPINQPKPSLKWPRDRVLQIRLENVCLAVEKNEWPTFRSVNAICMPHSTTPSVTTADSSPRPSSPCSLSSASQEHTPHPTPDHTPRRESQSPFTGDYFYSNNNSSATINSSLINSFDNENTRRRRRRRRRFEMDNERNNKLQSLLNTPFEQPTTIAPKPQTNSKLQSSLSANTNNSISSLASTFFNKKNQQPNSLINPSQFLNSNLQSLLSNLPLHIVRSALVRDDHFDEKTGSLLIGNNLSNNMTKSNIQSKSMNLDSKNLSSAPPPAHQSSSSRNSLPLGTLDLTSKFKNVSASTSEKTSVSANRSNLPYPAHKSLNKNLMSDHKTDVLDLSSVPSKHDSKSMSNLLSQSLHKSINIELKNSSMSTTSNTGKKKQGKIGIDALALNLQAKKMMEEVKQVDTATTLVNKSKANFMPKNFSEKEFLSALSSSFGGDKRSNNMLFDEFTKQANIGKSKIGLNSSASSSVIATTAPMVKKPVDISKSSEKLLESLKLLAGKSGKDFLQKMLEERVQCSESTSNPASSFSSLLSASLLSPNTTLTGIPHNSPSVNVIFKLLIFKVLMIIFYVLARG